MEEYNEIDLKDFRDFENLEFYAKQIVEGFITGLHKSPFHGFSVEFLEHRIYNPGESTKNIDWKLYGRTDRLYTKRYEEETNLRCHFLLDTSGSMFYPEERASSVEEPNKILFSGIAILALMNLLRGQRDAVGLSTFGNFNLQTETRSTYRHHRAINTELLKVLKSYNRSQKAKVSLVDHLHLIAQNLNKRSLIIVFSDFFEMINKPEAFFDALQHLKYNKHEIVLFWTTDKSTELDFNFDARPYRFVDIESGESLKLNPSDLKLDYQKQSVAFQKELEMRCMQYKIDLLQVDVSEGYNRVLQSYLIKRQKMR